jgi:hypothetical protein
VVDLAVRQPHRRRQPVEIDGILDLDPKRPRDVRGYRALGNEAANGLDRQVRRHFAGIVSTHAVGDHEQAKFRP